MRIFLTCQFFFILLLFGPKAVSAQTPDLGASSTFALFTASGAFNGDAATSVVGDIGTNAGAFTPPGFLIGQIHLADPVSAQAAADVASAYGYLAGLTCGSVLATPLGNSQILAPNIYCIGSAAVLNADLILDGGGNPGAIFIFQIDGALSTNPSSRILLINGANLCNVYWQINGAFNGGGNTLFQGTILAAGAINLANGAQLNGRGLSTEGAISTSANVVTLSNACLCTLSVTCPPANGGTFQCISDIPLGIPSNVTVNSACGTSTVAITENSTGLGCLASPFVLTRTYTVSDQGGFSTTCEVTYNAIDQTPPSLSCPANATVSCASNVPAPAPGSITASDLCGGAVSIIHVGDVISNQTCANRFTVTRTYRATDLCGNSATCAQTITVNDVAQPTLTCPANLTVSCANTVPVPTPGSITASDLCGGAVSVIHVGDVISNQICANRFTITRTYRATDVCGNSATCAQTITVNDGALPTLTCLANLTVSCANEVPAPTPGSITASDLCGGTVSVIHVGDVISNQTCANRFTITRTYRATDVCGNAATCAQTITVNDIIAPTFTDIPANVTVECNLIPPIATPTASDNCAGLVTVTFLGETQTQGICPTLYTLTRSWRATDACGNSATAVQLVTVQDTYAPQFSNMPLDVVLECDLASNEAAYQDWLDNFGGATVVDCSPVTWTLGPSPFFTMPSMCGGTSQRFIRFTATDACGNAAFRDASFTIVDLTPPTFNVLPQNLIIQCVAGDNGEAQFIDWFEHFGYAEASDNCGSVVTEIALLANNQACGNTFNRTYQFRATDECGNTNYVTATFAVVDTTPPVIVKCPEGNVLLTCVHDIPAPDTAGVIAWDNCGAPVSITLQSEFSVGVGCGYWPLTKSYTYAATDECGNVSTCYQSFQVVDSIPPVYTGQDTIEVICVADLPGPGEIAGILAPLFVDNCYTSFCIYEGLTQNGVNSVTYCVKAKDLCVNWTDKFLVTFIATGGCKPLCTVPQTLWGSTAGAINGMTTTEAIEQLFDKYGSVTAGKLGKTISISNVNCLQQMLPANGSTIQLSPGNFEFGSTNECQSASPLLNSDGTLKNKLVANVLAMQLNIWYNLEFNERDLGVQTMASLPPCLVDLIVLNKLEADHGNVQGLLNLSNDYLAGVGFYPPNFGTPLNSALENLNQYWQNCQAIDPCAASVSVAGSLKTEAQDGLEEGRLQLEHSGHAGLLPNLYTKSDAEGHFQFSDALPFAGSYTIIPSSENMGSLNGVTTYDLVLLSKHLLGLAPLNSPYKMIAADANRSGSITSFDIVEFRKLILGIYQELPDNTPWRFVDKSFVFPEPTNPFSTAFPEHKTVENVQASQMTEDFVSVKIGDLNGTAQANGLMVGEERNQGVLIFDVDDRRVRLGETFEVKLTAAQMVQGYQCTLHADGLEVLDVSGKNMDTGNFAVFAAEGALTISWDLPKDADEALAEFTVKLHAAQSGMLSEMLHLSSRITKSEAYQTLDNALNPNPLAIELRFHEDGVATHSGLDFELYQNVPNPFSDKTSIGFYLPEASQATLTVYDETGRLVYTQQGDFAKGYNAFLIAQALIKTNGTLLYKLATATDLGVKKMIQAN